MNVLTAEQPLQKCSKRRFKTEDGVEDISYPVFHPIWTSSQDGKRRLAFESS
jgi:hypothetical protein